MGSTKPYKIVVGIDGTELGDLAIVQAFELARDRPDTEIHAIHVVTGADLRDVAGREMDKRDHVLQTLPHETWVRLERLARGMHQPPGRMCISVHVRFGPPAETIHQVAVDYDADIIVVGTHGFTGFERMLLGSVATRLLEIARCPVLIARTKHFEGLPKTERVEPRPTRPSQPPPDARQSHVYVSSQEVTWTQHDSDAAGPTGVPMI